MTRKELAEQLMTDESHTNDQVLVRDPWTGCYDPVSGVRELDGTELVKAKSQYESYGIPEVLNNGASVLDLG